MGAPGPRGCPANGSAETILSSDSISRSFPSYLVSFFPSFLPLFPWHTDHLWNSPGLCICLNLRLLPSLLRVNYISVEHDDEGKRDLPGTDLDVLQFMLPLPDYLSSIQKTLKD